MGAHLSPLTHLHSRMHTAQHSTAPEASTHSRASREVQLDPQLTSTVALLSILLVTAINITSPKQAIICGETRSDHKLEIEGS